jgi:hypothetical protein
MGKIFPRGGSEMKTWHKALLGCGGLGCTGLVGLFALAVLSGSLGEYEKRGRAYREHQEHQTGETGTTAEPETKAEPSEPSTVAPPVVEPVRPEPPPFVMEHGEPMTLTRWVFRVHLDQGDPASLERRVFPEREGVVAWVASRNVEGDGRRFAIYEYTANDPHIEFAVESQKLVLPGRNPKPGCYRYLGILEGKSFLGNPVPVMLFRWEFFDHPLCAVPSR